MHDPSLRVVFAEAEVNHLDAGQVVGLVKHEVLGLDVSVRYLL